MSRTSTTQASTRKWNRCVPGVPYVLVAVLVLVLVGIGWLWRGDSFEDEIRRFGGQFEAHNDAANPAERIVAPLLGYKPRIWTRVTLSRTEVDDAWLWQHRHELAGRQGLNLDLSWTHVGDDALEALADLDNLDWLNLSGTDVTAAGLRHLAASPVLHLDISRTRIADEQIAGWAGLPKLSSIGLDASQVSERSVEALAARAGIRAISITEATDADVQRFSGWSRLQVLILDGKGVTDASIPALSSLSNLSHLPLQHTSVTPQGFDALRKALPQCQVVGQPAWPEPEAPDADRSQDAVDSPHNELQ